MNNPNIEIVDLKLKDAFIIKSSEFHDERGSFYKVFNREALSSRKIQPLFPEEYLSVSNKGVIRGLHYQAEPFSQAKLIRCIKGSLVDVFVDLRKNSPTFGKWLSVKLGENDNSSLYVPRGFAHGFISLENGTTMLYKADNDYSPENEQGILWNDPSLKIDWPKMKNYIISKKDQSWSSFKEAYKFG